MSLEFQIYDYRESHQSLDEDSETDKLGEYIIQVFGRTMDGKSVYAKLINFQPRFYIKVPEKWTSREIKRMEKYLKSPNNKKIWKMHRDCLESISLVKRKKAYGFTNNKLFKYAVLFFKNMYSCKKFASLFELDRVYIPGVTQRPLKFGICESNLAPMLRCFHMQDIPGCGWVEACNFRNIDKDDKESICDHEIILEYKYLQPIEKSQNAPLKICSFDIECYSCDGMFPQPTRSKDAVIQIGSTYNILGDKNIYRKHIVTLDTCDKIDGVVVESYEEERELLLGWLEEIKKNDIDILTGYNIFYFDEDYIQKRAKLLGIEIDMCYISKLTGHKCKFNTNELSSSALGQNILKYYDTPGIVHIDLMKDVQKTYKLESFKLDRVASNFIKGKVESVKKLKNNKYELKCKDKIEDLLSDDYIHLELFESYISEDIGEKFKVRKIDDKNNIIVIKSDLDLTEECDFGRGTLFWSQAKDDVPPKEIFRMQDMGPKERAKVAKYCVKDCVLVNLLVEKLQVVTKNIEMANVCYVPLSYIFVRGQGIKLFSLCLKEFRKEQYVFPVMRKPDEDLGKYEGAIVFDPVAAVNYESFAVKDYASLYPSAIIQKNISHETKVTDPDYDNLEGVEYFNAEFVDNEGNLNYRRYAKLKGEFGMVPKILQKLLGERKAVKKQMKSEKDAFKYSILDAKQLALKITANSLYGQLGASTSPVRERDSAACTTSTGREMLILAKKYDEEILPWIINGLQLAYKKGDTNTIDNIYKKELKDVSDNKLKEKVEKFCNDTEGLVFNPIIEYGDSVIGDTPLLVKVNEDGYGYSSIETVYDWLEDNNYKYERINDKDYLYGSNVKVFTEKGETDIVKVIRHKCEKTIYRITTESGFVDVSEDHSLLDKNGNKIKPSEVKVNDELLGLNNDIFFDSKITEYEISENIINYYEKCMKENKTFHYIFNNKIDCANFEMWLFKREKGLKYCHYRGITAEELYVEVHDFEPDNKIISIYNLGKTYDYVYDLETDNHHFHVGPGKLVVHNTDSIFSCYKYREGTKKLDDNKSLKLFQRIVEFGREMLEPFIPKEYNEMYNDLYNKYYGKISKLKLPTKIRVKPKPDHNEMEQHVPMEDRLKRLIKEYVEESYFPWLWTMQSLFSRDLDYLDKSAKEEIVDIRLFRHGFSQLKKIRVEEELFSDADKYHLINKVKTFCNDILGDRYLVPYWKYKDNKLEYRMKIMCGGKIIKDKRNLDYSVNMGIISGDLIKKRLPFPHDLEYEKTFWPFLILTKKRYVGNKYEFDLNKFKFDFMGIVLKRRDNAPIVKEICSGIINKLLVDRDPEGAYEFLESCLTKMFNGEYNIKYFLQSRNLKAKESYADWTRIAHVVLAERIGVRDPGNKPQPGDRISYAAIEVANSKNKLQGDRIEIPEYIAEKNLNVDYMFYLTNQIEKPALQFLKLVIPNVKERLEDFKIRMNNKKEGIEDIGNYVVEDHIGNYIDAKVNNFM